MADKKMKFEYSGAPQGSPEWHQLRIGKVTASRLSDWLSVSRAKNTPGKPLKARLDYEKELMFERQFNTGFEKWVSGAMQEGTDFEDFGRQQYEKITGNECYEVGCWYNEYFCASPDRGVIEKGKDVGLLEVKILKDNSFLKVLTDGVLDEHWKQCQGQLFASGKEWVDYVAVNFNTRKVAVIRVTPDPEFQEWLELTIPEQLVTEELDTSHIHDIVGDVPQWSDETEDSELPKLSNEDKQFTKGW